MSRKYQKWHGRRGEPEWEIPQLAVRCDEACRADQGNRTPSHEYLDSPAVLEAKMHKIAEMLQASRCCVAYTGAGLSRAAGIADYATKSKNSISSNGAPKLRSPLDAQPTYAHRVLAALHRRKMVHHYVQQNHDGLPQKAGFPPEAINEIHGAWYDPSNPVVQFDESLRTDLFDWMVEMEQKSDMCLCLGTSLSGMNADRMADTPAEKMMRGEPGILGTVIINLQQTPLDKQCAIRVWAPLDVAFEILARILSLDTSLHAPPKPPTRVIVPYNEHGIRDLKCRMELNLGKGARIQIANPHASNRGSKGSVQRVTQEGDVFCTAGRSTVLGRWWVLGAMRGAVPYIPVVNQNPRIERSDTDFVMPEEYARIVGAASEADDESDGIDMVVEAANPAMIAIVQKHREVPSSHGNNHSWSVELDRDSAAAVKEVVWHLHPTFNPAEVVCTEAPFYLSMLGWGTFDVMATITLKNDRKINAAHALSFDGPECVTRVKAC